MVYSKSWCHESDQVKNLNRRENKQDGATKNTRKKERNKTTRISPQTTDSTCPSLHAPARHRVQFSKKFALVGSGEVCCLYVVDCAAVQITVSCRSALSSVLCAWKKCSAEGYTMPSFSMRQGRKLANSSRSSPSTVPGPPIRVGHQRKKSCYTTSLSFTA